MEKNKFSARLLPSKKPNIYIYIYENQKQIFAQVG